MKLFPAAIQIHIQTLETGLEKINEEKNQYLYGFIKKYWPRQITPNHLSWVRVSIGLLLFILLFNFRNDNGLFILPLFLIGALTDFLDGPIARCLNMKTKLGEALDPVADRILLIPVFIYTIIDYQVLLFFIIFFEVANAFLALISQGKNVFEGSNIFGKTKMFLQSVVLIAILLFWPGTPNLFFISLLWVSVACILISVSIKILALRSYYYANSHPGT